MRSKNRPCRGGCRDQHLFGYYASGNCGTPYCGGWFEVHCRKCGWYTASCPCGANNAQTKLSYRGWKAAIRRTIFLNKEAVRAIKNRVATEFAGLDGNLKISKFPLTSQE